MVTKAVEGVAGDMVISPQMALTGYGTDMNMKAPTATESISGITSAITEACGQCLLH